MREDVFSTKIARLNLSTSRYVNNKRFSFFKLQFLQDKTIQIFQVLSKEETKLFWSRLERNLKNKMGY